MSNSRNKEIIGNIFVAFDVNEYSEFFIHPKARELAKLVHGSQLEAAVDNLGIDLKAASNTMRLPWLTIANIERIGLTPAIETTVRETFVTTASNVLPQSKELNISKVERLKLSLLIQQLGNQLVKDRKRDKAPQNRQVVWDSLVQMEDENPHVKEFTLARIIHPFWNEMASGCI